MEIPLFPLQTVLFPGGPLALRIFEPRYLGMVARCLKLDEKFGVLTIRTGSETGAAETFATGTLAEIVGWHQDDDGLLGITAIGRGRFRLESRRRQKDGLYLGQIQSLSAEPRVTLPTEYEHIARFLERLLREPGSRYRGVDTNFGDASWVGYRLAEILPLAVDVKQSLLEMEDATARLEQLAPAVERLEAEEG